MELFKLLGTIAIDSSDAERTIDNITSKSESSESRISGAFKKIGTAVVTYFAVDKIKDFGHAGATVPLTGFGYSLAKGVEQAVENHGLLGAFTGGLQATAGGIAAAIGFGILFSLFTKPRDK
mgnify:CR=1 FL=1